jgi:GT2 family glycosyltransferase
MEFENNFDVSVVLPFYKKLSIFKNTLPRNAQFFQRNGIEVIVVMDECSEQDALLTFIKQYPFINWKVIVNEIPHGWRNPSKVINVGIRAAVKKYVLVMGPDSEMTTDMIFEMRKMAEFYPNSFFVGRVAFVDYAYSYTKDSVYSLNPVYYGSVFAERAHFISINGYDEKYEKWGGDDDNLRARFEFYGLKKIRLPFSLLLHRESSAELEHGRKKEKSTFFNRTLIELKNSFTPDSYLANSDTGWGTDFSKVVFDWTNNIYARELCQSYLACDDFQEFELKPGVFDQHYKVIALISTFNEQRHITEILHHLNDHCDGVILLDDVSDDDTYALASSDKLLLKVRKSVRTQFDDLNNRNLLLNLACFFKSEFYFFIDADERFDPRYGNLTKLAASGMSDTYCFHLVHLWDNDTAYRTDVPEISQINRAGILQRWRMFKNIGRMNIRGNRLHFEATPYKNKKSFAPILIKHFGMIDPATRKSKFIRYHNEDEDLHKKPNKYDYFLDDHVNVCDVSEIVLPNDFLNGG